MTPFASPKDFNEIIAKPSIALFRANPAGYREGFNSFLAIDALAAQIYVAAEIRGPLGAQDDTYFRGELAEKCEHFRLVRDVAKALKHCELTRGSPMLKRASDCKIGARNFGSGLFGVGSYGGEDLMIEISPECAKHAISEVILAHRYLLGSFSRWGL